ncbi:MAG: LicD family protein, partial [Muribaculaceae bacterium]|nr:LicD family protein [Muribaculaceae bacterium]
MIDNKIQAELRQRFNPDGSDLRKVQLRMLEMLKYVDKICRENNIKYWLSSGTCLGAVRHGGFIPWDDDVDIELEKTDFKRLIKILSKDNKYFLQTHSTDIEYLSPYAKLREKDSFLKEQNNI